MYAHLQIVSLSFMDKTEVGPADVAPAGRRLCAAGVPGILDLRDRRSRAAGRHRRRAAEPGPRTRRADAFGGAGAVPGPHRLAALCAARLPAARARPAARSTARWPRTSTACARSRKWRREDVNFAPVRREGARQPAGPSAASKFTNMHDPDRRYADRAAHGDRRRVRRRAWCSAAGSTSASWSPSCSTCSGSSIRSAR